MSMYAVSEQHTFWSTTVRLFIDAASAAEDERRIMVITNVDRISGVNVKQMSAIRSMSNYDLDFDL